MMQRIISKRWTVCSCKHIAQDHNVEGLPDGYGCDHCSCLAYDGREEYWHPTEGWQPVVQEDTNA